MSFRKGYSRGFYCSLGGFCALWLATGCLAAEALSTDAYAEIRRIWTVEAAEGAYQVLGQACVASDPSGRLDPAGTSWEEHIQLATAEGAWVDLTAPVRPVAIIDELQLSVEVFGSRHGLRLIAEVALPHARDARGEPLRVQIFGPVYARVGDWERLALGGLPRQVERSVRTLQLTMSKPIDARGAYVDGLRLRVRPGRGETTVRLREPFLRGAVHVQHADGAPVGPREGGVLLASGESLPPISPHASARNGRGAAPQIRLSGGVVHVFGEPLFPRAIEHSRGPLRDARNLGCNVVVLSSPPTHAQEREAEAADLWLVAPPPDPQSLAAAGAMPPFPRVLAWHLGRRLTTVDLESTRQWAGLLRRLDPARGRPLVASVHYGHRAFSRVLDIVVLEREPVGGSLSLDRFVQQIEAERRLVLPGKTVWTWIQTQLPAEVVHQARCLAPPDRAALDTHLPTDAISRLTWIAVAHGSHGIVFGAPAGGHGTEQDATAIELQLINRQLDLLHTWLVGTDTARRVAELAPGLQAGILSSGRTHWVLPWHMEDSRHVSLPIEYASDSPRQRSYIIPGVSEPSDALLVTTTGPQRVTATREAGGVRVVTGPLLPRDAILLTQDALAAQRLGALAAAQARQTAAHERALLGAAEMTGDVRALRLSLGRTRDQASRYAAEGSFRSCALDRFPELTDLGESFLLLDRRPLPTPNLLPAGDFEGLDEARQAGWRHVQLVHGTTHEIDLVSTEVHSGASCLRMSHAGSSEAAGDVVTAAWLSSPVVPLNAGDVIRLSGWVRASVAEPAEAPARALVEDSLGGEPLSLNMAPGPQWQPFVLYRATDKPHPWSVRLSCSGPGAVFFDDLIVQRVVR